MSIHTHAVELDIVDEDYDTLDDAIAGLIAEIDVTANVIRTRGPANWPVVRFTGTIDAINSLLARYTDDPDDLTDYVFSL